MDALQAIWKFLVDHEAACGLLALAAIATMPAKLPPPFNRLACLEWSWEWLHDTLKAFVSFRMPAKPVPPEVNK